MVTCMRMEQRPRVDTLRTFVPMSTLSSLSQMSSRRTLLRPCCARASLSFPHLSGTVPVLARRLELSACKSRYLSAPVLQADKLKWRSRPLWCPPLRRPRRRDLGHLPYRQQEGRRREDGRPWLPRHRREELEQGPQDDLRPPHLHRQLRRKL